MSSAWKRKMNWRSFFRFFSRRKRKIASNDARGNKSATKIPPAAVENESSPNSSPNEASQAIGCELPLNSIPNKPSEVEAEPPGSPLPEEHSQMMASEPSPSAPSNDTPQVVVKAPSFDTVTQPGEVAVVIEPSRQPPESHVTIIGGFNNASHIVMDKPVMADYSTTVNNSTTVNILAEDKVTVAKAMELLSKHIISGAGHNAAARFPPPKCHPDTRIEINKRIVDWFYYAKERKLFLWINGFAGVGKSAIIQTFAEKLAETKHLGASVFISRPKQRNDSQRIFITIAYQLATHIEAYRNFISERLVTNPDLVNMDMKEQFRTFIYEPFTEKKIGAGAEVWGVLLDGLDELDEQPQQKEIVRIIAAFVLDHPYVPLLWVIASRPEPHISLIFQHKEIVPSYREEYVPIDSIEARQDVERYLRSKFEKIRSKFPRLLPKIWPTEAQFSKLATAASGLFVFADVALRFIENPDSAAPSKRLEQVLAVIDGLEVSSKDHPFALLDALYANILTLVPSDMWPITRRLFSVGLYAEKGPFKRHWALCLDDLKGVSVILGLDLYTIYAALHNCYSILQIPHPENIYERSALFYHASFGEYLRDSKRSGGFRISIESAEEDILGSLLKTWFDFKVQSSSGPDSGYFTRWISYCSQYHSNDDLSYPSRLAIDRFDLDLFNCLHGALFVSLAGKHDPAQERGPFASQLDQDQCFHLLSQIDVPTLCYGFLDYRPQFSLWLMKIWKLFTKELTDRHLVREVQFQHLRFDRFDWPNAYPTHTWCDTTEGRDVEQWQYQNIKPSSLAELHQYVSGLESFKKRCPELPVLICGKVAMFKYQYSADEFEDRAHSPLYPKPSIGACGYYTIPYPGDKI